MFTWLDITLPSLKICWLAVWEDVICPWSWGLGRSCCWEMTPDLGCNCWGSGCCALLKLRVTVGCCKNIWRKKKKMFFFPPNFIYILKTSHSIAEIHFWINYYSAKVNWELYALCKIKNFVQALCSIFQVYLWFMKCVLKAEVPSLHRQQQFKVHKGASARDGRVTSYISFCSLAKAALKFVPHGSAPYMILSLILFNCVTARNQLPALHCTYHSTVI